MAGKREIRTAANKYMKLMGFAHPWRVFVNFQDGTEEPLDKDKDPHATAEIESPYKVAWLTFDPKHVAWKLWEGGKVDSGVRHELAHVTVSPLARVVEHLLTLVADEQTRKVLERMAEDAEDEVVTSIESMPVWKEVE